MKTQRLSSHDIETRRLEHRAEVIRQSNEYRSLTADERTAVEHSPVYMRAAYILQLLSERAS